MTRRLKGLGASGVLVTAMLGIASSLSAPAKAGTAADPLFADDSVLELRIEGPFEKLMRKRPDEDYLPGKLSYVDADGATVTIDVGLRTRGDFRRRPRVCPFAPLRLNLVSAQTAGTLFANQDKLKMVTHCRSHSQHYEQTVLTEYLAYRILNVVTDASYRVRLLRVTYDYTDNGQQDMKPAFLLESDERLGYRIGRPPLVIDEIDIDDVEPEHLNLTSVFQFLIGNTDFSPIKNHEGDDCCHNYALFGTPGEPLYSIPFDFDMVGLVDARHAVTNPRFRLRSVRERLYRGRCRNNDYLDQTIARFSARRDDIENLVKELRGLSGKTRADTLRYIRSFYNIVESPKRRDKQLVKRCI